MAGYIGANTSSVTNNQNAAERRKKFTFTANTTVLSGLNFAPQKIHIFHNGIRLVRTTDYTEAADGKSVTLTNAAQAGDEVVAVTFAQDPASNAGYTDADVDAHLLTAGVTLDATNDRVGVGTATPSVPLDVVTAGGGNFVAKFQNTTSATPYGVHVKDAASGANGYPLFQVTNSAGSTAHLKVMSGTGHVLMASQPYFAAEMTGNNAYTTRTAGTALPFNSVRMNTVSGSFNASSYRYTAPVSGKYLMIAGGITNQANPNGRLMFYVNGGIDYTGQGSSGVKYGINGSNTAGAGSTLTSAIIPMVANDYVDVRSQAGNTHLYEGDHSFWTGMLLG